MLTAFSIAAPVASSTSEHFGLSVQQADHLKIKENLIATHDMVLYTVIHDTGFEMAQVLLGHDDIDVNLKNRLLKGILILVAKNGCFPVANGFVVDGRRNVGNSKISLYCPRNNCIWRAIESMMEDHNYHQPSLAPSPRGRIDGL
jgi:ankyrin repeat protein